MAINIRQKGAQGERDVIAMLKLELFRAMTEMSYPSDQIASAQSWFQRNQNQSAVGGNDLSNTFDLSIEVKRQEQLSINTWWAQCCAAATKSNETPVLIFRQSKQKWRVITMVWIPLPDGGYMPTRAEISIDDFKSWFREWVKKKLRAGWKIQS